MIVCLATSEETTYFGLMQAFLGLIKSVPRQISTSYVGNVEQPLWVQFIQNEELIENPFDPCADFKQTFLAGEGVPFDLGTSD